MTSYPNDPTNADRPYDPGQQSYGSTAGDTSQTEYVATTGTSPTGSYGTTGASEYADSGSSAKDAVKAKAEDVKAKAQDAADSVRGPATDVKDTATEAGKQVAATAKGEAMQVLEEGKQQGRRVFDEGVAELRNQAANVQTKLADAIQALADELSEMTSGTQTGGTVATFAGQAQGYTERAATWLRDNDMQTALYTVRRYAARNPWGFLAISAGAGLLVGRFARGLKDAGSPESAELYGRGGYGSGYGTEVYGRPYGDVTTSAYADPTLQTAYGQSVAGQSAYDRPVGSDGGVRPADYGIHGETTGDTTTEYDVRGRTDLG